MFYNIVASTRPQYDALVQLIRRDVPLQLSALYLVCGLCWWVGHPIVAIGTAVLATSSEFLIQSIVRKAGPFKALSKDHVIIISLGLCSVNTVMYLFPAFCLVSAPSLAMKITGMMWIMGAQVFLANTWARVPVFLSVMLIPAMLMMILAFLLLRNSPPEVSSMTEWGFAMGVLALFLYSGVDTLQKQLTTEAELAAAQKDAASRLVQLEEAHRLDALTGLLNRPAFDLALAVMLEDRLLNGGEVTVFLVDLDSFKPINDTYSHEAGDEVLLQTAKRLETHVGDAGIVGRLGGDEFICAVEDLGSHDAAIDYANSLMDSMAVLIHWHGRQLKIGASVGIAMTGDSALSPHSSVPALCSAADQAMFASKSSPNGDPAMYRADQFAPRMTAQDKQVLIESISTRTLKPYFQSKVHLPTGQIIGFEALARWEHPTKGVRQPADFIYQINDLGLQGDFMISMAQQVMTGIRKMLSLGLDPGQVSFNVPEVALATHSGRQDLLKIVSADLEAAQHLTMEITEDVFIARAADTIQTSISAFRALGVRISLDDFGTGFASFHHLRQLDFDELKIDTSFVAGLGTDATAEVLVRGFLNIASGLGVSVVAEGVESEDQSRDLINMGCVTAQGYLFSEAVPFEQATKLLEKQQAA